MENQDYFAGWNVPGQVNVTILEANPCFHSLTQDERIELAECEETIKAGLQTFVNVGKALTRIRDGGLYRATHATFQHYCRERWEFGRSKAYRLIGAADVVSYLSPIGDIPQPVNESQVRPLIGLQHPQIISIWKRAAVLAGGKAITARLVKQALIEMLGKEAFKTTTMEEILMKFIQLLNQTETLMRRNKVQAIRVASVGETDNWFQNFSKKNHKFL